MSSLGNRFEEVKKVDALDEKLGFYRYQEGPEKLGWLINMHATLVKDSDHPTGRAGVDLYFLEEDGNSFKSTVLYSPYFLIGCKPDTEGEVEEFLRRKFENILEKVQRVQKKDLHQPNHLLGLKRTFLRLTFRNVQDLLSVRKFVLPIIKKNQETNTATDIYSEINKAKNVVAYEELGVESAGINREVMDNVIDIREYDIPYYLRVAIDNDIRVGLWYNVKATSGQITIKRRFDKVKRAEPVVLAYDIETTKLPLKFPDASIDSIMMISYMVDGQGYLITNREIISEDIDDFEYTPKPEFEGPFIIFNEPNEEALIRRFFEHIQELKPTVFVTYNGDFFDWPFVETRALANGISMYEEIGFAKDDQDEYKSKYAIHMDALRWVKRDSYLPVGSQGLKAVTTSKLGYNPVEIDPEDMTRFASEQPQTLSEYSVSDAVATYYLYMKYVHPFIFSLCNIIPLNPDEVLRKGTGTLCEVLLMVEAYQGDIIMPNKHVDKLEKFYESHLIESETYVGGHVEALEAGVFRSDIPVNFKVGTEAIDKLIGELDAALKFSIQVEGNLSLDQVSNYDEVRQSIIEKLINLKETPTRYETPLIYHLDVAAMYPNIILTNRLQPDAIIDEGTCASCDFNQPGKNCDRRLTWSWRGEYFPAKRSETNMIKNQLECETFPGANPNQPPRPYNRLPPAEQTALLRKRVKEYCKKVYKRMHVTKVVEKEAIICQRENPFYVNTVRSFRDRRYEYKGLHKTWKGNLDKAGSLAEADEAKKMIVLYDSLQLAHKCILNSFYGYVMRKGSRWYSMEMAGVVCLTGAKIIQMARQLVEQIGRPLELDTDGIWCILPSTFPENFTFKLTNGKKFPISYPCVMLNHLVHDRFTNQQYQELVNPDTFEYSVRNENSIFFEVDGPYRAMILPSSKEEDKLLKKRYAVFNDDGSLAELKGFEVKRRGELKLIKIFQSQIFKIFLEGSTLQECYAAVAKVADQWLDVLYSKAATLADDELFELIAENRSMSKTLEDYGDQKSTSISTAKRLAEFLGDQMVKDKGLACQFIISEKPLGLSVSERAIPIAIFSAETSVKKHYIRKWLKDNSIQDFDIRSILDWSYYLDRFASVVQKLITIPAAMQKVTNPVPRVRHPDWLLRRVAAKDDIYKQNRITDSFKAIPKPAPVGDIEDFGETESSKFKKSVAVVTKNKHRAANSTGHADVEVESEPEPEPEGPVPDMTVDYEGWLQYQKQKWKWQRNRKRKQRERSETNGPITKLQKGGLLRDFLIDEKKEQQSNIWEVLQITETEAPGEFRLWVLVNKRLQPIRIKVPRVFYVNSRVDIANYGDLPDGSYRCTRSYSILPRAHHRKYLYEFDMEEAFYRNNTKAIHIFFSHPSIEGVYETQVPMALRVLLHLGIVCTIKDSERNIQSKKSLYDLYQIQSQVNPDYTYLGSNDYLNYLYIYHANSDNRHIFGLFSTVTNQASLFVVDRAAGQIPNLAKLYGDRLAQRLSKDPNLMNGAFKYHEDLSFNVTTFPGELEAYQAIQKTLIQYSNEHRGSTMIALHSPMQYKTLNEKIRALSDFPHVCIPSHKKDNIFPALDWQRHAARRMVAHYLNVSSWLNERISLARYANVPLGNIEVDAPIFLADVFFARRLKESGFVLWWSPSAKPDLGGKEQDENLYTLDEIVNPEINNPGAYNSVCIEADIRNLAVNTVLQSGLINELEGSMGVTGFDSVAHSLDEHMAGDVESSVSYGDGYISGQTFGMLKAMIKGWCREFAETNNRFANMMILHFYRWVMNTGSKLHDPCLYGLIHKMMQKVFVQLTGEFKRLGSKIVYASLSKVILATPKTSMGSATMYGSYIFNAIRQKPLFQDLDFDSLQFWESALWMDSANYGGIITTGEIGSSAGGEPSVEMHWNMRDYLPVAIQEKFQIVIAEFIYECHKHRVERRKDNNNMAYIVGSDVDVDFKKKFISHYFTRRLLKMVPEVVEVFENFKATQGGQDPFPKLPGSYIKLTNPALEFIKYICQVFGLDEDIEREVRILRRNLLDLIGVREFSTEAQFQNPCESYKLMQFICDYCNHCRDFDFCRDPDLLPVDGVPQPWLCPGCRQEYDKSVIEDALVENIQRKTTAYQLQDLKCSKCRLVKAENLTEYCQCSGNFVLTQSRKELNKQLTVLRNIAKLHELEFLGEVVEWLLSKQ
ncbi:putative DNA polymerase epsilon catalytic subunit A [Basidiobolus meristosporus CBS 931.73]|uniref:DNA polymerase epsilon catalytic subunit n=1 Tax=Basidiobolus meristosporus CBS 931.73 TaxID=1314790 RepID=A0A1Y1XYP0_9FUNG|nr:putative DNA polymerase epsilon catalytic subunit A [Basidiobolus meristosporus CBS 931.73]|eukprot:ORX90877.1 putative DNA polymerase epsilon catalytic subunit A [Basidiobolus meristosporus CBS 931.73]